MAAAEHAPGSAFPEQVIQFVDLRLVVAKAAEKERIHGPGFVSVQKYIIFVQESPQGGFIL
jgi:hypothetical protein